MTFIYALIDPTNYQTRYIGKSNNPEARLADHIQRSLRNTRKKDRWIQSLSRQSLMPLLNILEEISDENWQICEREWIRYYRNLGANLCNHTDGGDGVHNPDKESRQRLSEARKKLWQIPEFRDRMMASLQDKNRREKISKALTGLNKSPSHIAKLPQNNPGHKLTDSHRAKISASSDHHSPSPENIEKIRERMRGNRFGLGNRSRTGQTRSVEERAKSSKTTTGRPKSKIHKEHLRQGALRRWSKYREEHNNETLRTAYSDQSNSTASANSGRDEPGGE